VREITALEAIREGELVTPHVPCRSYSRGRPRRDARRVEALDVRRHAAAAESPGAHFGAVLCLEALPTVCERHGLGDLLR
jgi:hypothetical protein